MKIILNSEFGITSSLDSLFYGDFGDYFKTLTRIFHECEAFICALDNEENGRLALVRVRGLK
jgi:hypothetical protein